MHINIVEIQVQRGQFIQKNINCGPKQRNKNVKSFDKSKNKKSNKVYENKKKLFAYSLSANDFNESNTSLVFLLVLYRLLFSD